jgi:hypothetical protein
MKNVIGKKHNVLIKYVKMHQKHITQIKLVRILNKDVLLNKEVVAYLIAVVQQLIHNLFAFKIEMGKSAYGQILIIVKRKIVILHLQLFNLIRIVNNISQIIIVLLN